jgi:hypothetical protein
VKLSNILNQQAPLAITFPTGDKLNLVYRPGQYTPKFESEVRKASEADDKDALSCMLGPLLLSWDLTDDDGAPIACDVDTLHGLPNVLLSATLSAILKDMSPNKKASDSSANG